MDTNRIAVVVFAVLMVISVVAVPWTAAAQEEPSGPPASYYGDVTINGEPAPVGTTIEAVVDGEVVGSITTNESGQYGAPGRFEDKLLVGQKTSIENGSEVQFYADSDEIDRTLVTNTNPETVEWESGDVQEVDLTFENVPESDDSDSDDSGDDTSSGGGSSGGGSSGDAPAPVEEVGAGPTTAESVTPTVDAETGRTVAAFQTSQNVESVALDTTETVDDVTVSDLDPDTETEAPAPGQPVSLQDITVSGASGEIENTPATIRFRISSERLEERGTTAENLRAFRLNNGDWQRLETSVAAETDTGVVLEADTPGFSVFAVSAVTPPEGSIALDPGTATVNEAVELSGAESTDPDGEIVSYEWSVDGETLTGETVTVALEEPGEYTVELVVTDDAGETDTVTGTLVAEAADTATPGSDTSEPDVESPTGPVEEPGGFDTLPVVVVAIVLLLGAGYAVYRQRER